jgi:hypothetical protein
MYSVRVKEREREREKERQRDKEKREREREREVMMWVCLVFLQSVPFLSFCLRSLLCSKFCVSVFCKLMS